MSDTPIVSIIVPTYNRAAFIGAAVESVLAQDFRDFELIIVDDGSTDDTVEIMGRFEDGRVRYIPQPNRGRSNARNHALSLVRGKYIAFLDSDDLYLPGKLALQVAFMESRPEVGMVYTSARCIDVDGNPLKEKYVASVSGKIYRSIAFFKPVTITLPTVMVRREIMDQVGGFDEQMHRFEDTDMWRRIAKCTHIEAMPEETCLLRTHEDNHLLAQKVDDIVHALNYYVAKIEREDAEVSWVVKRRGFSELYYYYFGALVVVPKWRSRSLPLVVRSFLYWPVVPIRRLFIPLFVKKLVDVCQAVTGFGRQRACL